MQVDIDKIKMPVVKDGSNIAVWFSCGAASAVAAKMILDRYRESCNVRVLNNRVIEEHPDSLRFLKDFQQWAEIEVEEVTNPTHQDCSAEDIWEDRRYMSGIHGAPCTMLLKRDARIKWEYKNKVDWHVLGYTFGKREIRRFKDFASQRPALPILIANEITKQECYDILREEGVELPEMYKLGFGNNNCIGCVKTQSPAYWNLIRKHFPITFQDRSKLSREIGCKLAVVKGERIFLDELKVTDKGGTLSGVDCGFFCEREYLDEG